MVKCNQEVADSPPQVSYGLFSASCSGDFMEATPLSAQSCEIRAQSARMPLIALPNLQGLEQLSELQLVASVTALGDLE